MATEAPSALDLHAIIERADPPSPWAEGDNIPWDDPEFSARMLEHHLSEAHDLASRRASTVETHVRWLHERVLAERASNVLDLGCGPGLYLHRLAELGHQGVGIDFGPASIEYAHRRAQAQGLTCHFVHADLRAGDFGLGFDLAMLIYGQLNVFRREQAEAIVRAAAASLRPGGALVLEVQTAADLRGDGTPTRSWSSKASGLFSPKPHLTLHERFWDEETNTKTERWHVIEAQTSQVRRYALSSVAYETAEIIELLQRLGFIDVERFDSSLGSTEAGPGFMTFVAHTRAP
ncbi:MAG: class I SAM-dependent methyltransferase [Myxococcota bacterium]